LEAIAPRSGWQVVGFYEDNGINVVKSRDKRPGLDRLLKDATARKINMIAAWSVDRLGRSLQDLVGFLNDARTPMSPLPASAHTDGVPRSRQPALLRLAKEESHVNILRQPGQLRL
jgi:hypothetical protein